MKSINTASNPTITSVPAPSESIIKKRKKLLKGADPWVVENNGKYLFLLAVQPGNKLVLREYSDVFLNQLNRSQTIWESDIQCDSFFGIWAPELHRFPEYSDKWYIYYAECSGNIAPSRRMYVLESETSDPFSKFTKKGKIFDSKNDLWAIDLTVLNYNGKLFGIWSGWESENGEFPQNLYIAPMSDPWTISGKRVCISKPEHEWEKSIAAINEGPQILFNAQDRVFIVYSCDASWMPAYKLGLISLVGDDPLNPDHWIKNNSPVFEQGSTRVYGPGHASFIKKDNENYIVYHRKKSIKPGWDDRVVNIQPFAFSEDGNPSFGLPKNTN